MTRQIREIKKNLRENKKKNEKEVTRNLGLYLWNL